MNHDEAKAIKGEVARASQGFTRQSATVQSYRPYSGRGGIAVVTPDGPNASAMEAVNTTGQNLNPNDRVLLEFDPPAGAYVAGLILGPDDPDCRTNYFSIGGEVTAGLESAPWWPNALRHISLIRLAIRCPEASASDIVVSIIFTDDQNALNCCGTVMETLTLPAGDRHIAIEVDLTTGLDYHVHCEIVSSDGDVEGFGVEMDNCVGTAPTEVAGGCD